MCGTGEDASEDYPEVCRWAIPYTHYGSEYWSCPCYVEKLDHEYLPCRKSNVVYTVVIPKRSTATDEQARARQMPDITWEAQLEGAVHSVKVKGVLRATLSA